jgi:hypothetical protein
MEWVRDILFIGVLLFIGGWIRGRKWLDDETKKNDDVDPPSSRQLRWDIRHMREDLHMLVLINYTLVAMILFLIFYRFWKV